jgi:hypothetical protein
MDSSGSGPIIWRECPPRAILLDGARRRAFSALNFVDPKPSQGGEAVDAAEATTHFNLNLTAMDAAVDVVLRIGPGSVREQSTINRAAVRTLPTTAFGKPR